MTATAVVTGGAGFIGRALVNRLTGSGWKVVVIDDMSTHVIHEYPSDGVTFIQGRVQDAILREKQVDAIFHLAGKVGPVGVMQWKGFIAEDTIAAADRAGSWASFHGCPLIDVSTSEVYGNPSKSNSESDPKVFPYSASARMEYAVAKLAAETMLLNRDDTDVRVVRPFNVAGPGQKPDGGFVLPRFVRQALAGRSLTVYNPGTQRRSFTHVEDIVSGIIDVYLKGKAGEDYNLGSPFNECSMLELAQDVIAQVGKGTVSMVDPAEVWGKDFKEAADKVPDATKAMQQLGWWPDHDRATIIRDTIAYWKERAEL